jgi:hypothetical protein|nr:MAG TPA: hypothetical protein [Bacteriophage sp.]
MYILTDGKNYVMENPMKIGEYLATTSSVQAKEFTYKQARSLVQRGGKKYSWLRNYHLIDINTGSESENSLYYKGNSGVYMGDDNFDDSLLDKICEESNSILGLAGWNKTQLITYKNLLNAELSKCDSAESDINHALEKYKRIHKGKKPQAHKVAKIGYLLDDIRDKHRKVKQCIRYVNVMSDAIDNAYTIEKMKLELSKVSDGEYKGRTQYWEIANEILED